MKKAPREEPDERLTVTPPKTWATGVPAVTHALEYSLAETSVRRTGLTLLTMNQVGGIDCPGCAWADPAPGHRHVNEYCENGAKHINDEATSRRVTADFFRRHTVSGLGRRSDRWLNQQGRLTEPMVKRPGADHYEPISSARRPRTPGRRAAVAGLTGRGGLLHLGPGQQRGGVPPAALRQGLRHQQPARLQQHVPRVQRVRPARDPGHGQGHGESGRSSPRRPDPRGGAEPRDQPPASSCRLWRRPNATAPASSR